MVCKQSSVCQPWLQPPIFDTPFHPRVLHQCLVHPKANVRLSLLEQGALTHIDELYEPLKLM
eukprot:1159547-Pelagomonas_calceolata.AAC.13